MLIKHCLIVVLLSLAGIAGVCQNTQKLVISGNLKYATDEERVLDITYRKIGGGRYQFDSTIVRKGSFKIERDVDEPIIVVLSLRPKKGTSSNNSGTLDYGSLYLLPGTVEVAGSQNLKSAIVTGNAAIGNKDYQDFVRQYNLYVDTLNRTLVSLRNSSLNQTEREKRQVQIADSINAIRDQQVYRKFLTSKPQSPVAIYALLSYAAEPVWTPRKKMNPEEIEKLTKLLPQNFLKYSSIQMLKEELAASKLTGTGRPIIDFTLEDTLGRKVSLSDFKGKYVFLDFWASWCVPCRKENPNVKTQFQNFKDKGFTVVSVSLDKPDAKQAWLQAIRKDEIGLWTHLGDLNGFDGKVAKDYYVKSIPTNFLIGPDGKFLDRNLYGEALNKVLAKIFVNKN